MSEITLSQSSWTRVSATPEYPAALRSIAVLVLTSVHHAYGAVIYDTPWRMYVVFFSAPAAMLIAGLFYLGWKHRYRKLGRAATWAGIAVAVVFPIGMIGMFEGAYRIMCSKTSSISAARPTPCSAGCSRHRPTNSKRSDLRGDRNCPVRGCHDGCYRGSCGHSREAGVKSPTVAARINECHVLPGLQRPGMTSLAGKGSAPGTDKTLRVPMRCCRSQKPAKSTASVFAVMAGCHPARAGGNAAA